MNPNKEETAGSKRILIKERKYSVWINTSSEVRSLKENIQQQKVKHLMVSECTGSLGET